MTPTRRQVITAGGCAALGLTGCSATSTPTFAPVTIDAASVPVGGGIVLKDVPVVVTQPSAGQFAAFSAMCTHSQCKVSEVRREGIFCGCHGSVFRVTDASIVRGPATTPLPAITVSVDGSKLTIG